MKWRGTLLLLILVTAALLYVLSREAGDAGEARRRLEAGFLYPYPAAAVRSVEFAYPERTLRIERRERGGRERWWLTAPVEDPGDSVVIERMLATLAVQKVDRWLPPPTGRELAEYELAAPRFQLRLETKAGRDTLAFGAVNLVEKRLYARGSWRDSLALIGTLLRTHAMKGRYELADKRPMGDLPLARVESIEIANARGSFTLGRGERGWEIRRPEPYRADDRAVGRLLDRLWGESIIDFVDAPEAGGEAPGFEQPLAVMTVNLLGEARPRRLELGRPWFDLQRVRNSERSHAFLLDSTTVAPLTESFSAFMSTILVSFMPGQVRTIAGPDGSHIERREGEKWAWRDEAGAEVAADRVSALLGRILRLPTERVEALLPRSDQLTAWGLDPPDRRFSLEFEDGSMLVVEMGTIRDGRIALRRADYPTVYSLPEEGLRFPWPLMGGGAPDQD